MRLSYSYTIYTYNLKYTIIQYDKFKVILSQNRLSAAFNSCMLWFTAGKLNGNLRFAAIKRDILDKTPVSMNRTPQH
jgi:hypothetical protein